MVVVDARLAVKMVVPENFSAQAKALELSWDVQGIELAAPDFMASGYATALHIEIPEGLLTSDDAKQMMLKLYRSGMIFRPSRPLHNRAKDLAAQLNQRLAYDCHFLSLSLAESLNCDYWTADRPFYQAARNFYPSVQETNSLYVKST